MPDKIFTEGIDKVHRETREMHSFGLNAVKKLARRVMLEDDFKMKASLGLIDGLEVVRASGFNEDIDKDTTEIISTQGGFPYPYPLVEDFIDISSSSVNDAIAGTGARTVLVVGVNLAGLLVTETVELVSGGTVRTLKKFYRVNIVVVSSVGILGQNDGKVSLLHVISGDTLAEIVVGSTGLGQNRSFSTIQTIPDNKVALITGAVLSITKKSGGTGNRIGEVELRVREKDGVFIPINNTGLRSDGTGSLHVPLEYPLLVPSNADVEFIANSFSGNSTFTATYTYLLVDKETYGIA